MGNIEHMYDNNDSYRPPVSRFEVFKNIFKNSLGKLVIISLLTFLFALPLFIWLTLSVLAINGYVVDYAVADTVLKEQLLIKIFNTKVIMCMVSVPLAVLFSVGLAGAYYVIRKLVWDEGFMLMRTYSHGIKNNAKPFMLSTLFASVIVAICVVGYNYININPMVVGWVKIASFFILILLAILTVIIQMFVYTQIVIYELPLQKIIKNAIIFALVRIPSNIGIMLITALPMIIIFVVPHIISQIVGGFLLAIIGLSFIILVGTLYGHSVYDKYINKENHPEIFEKGIISKKN